MKTQITLFLLLLATASLAQTIRRVNNNPGITGTNIYSTIQAAHDAASSGDIIYVENSQNAHGNLTCTKQLVIVGAGYFLGQNAGLSANTVSGKIGTVLLNTGSSGTVISGVEVVGNPGQITVNQGVSNISISRCKMDFIVMTRPTAPASSYSNINISQNYIGGIDVDGNSFIGNPGSVSNVLVANNIFGGYFSLNSQFSGTAINNTILGGNNWNIQNFSVTNNIWGKSSLSLTYSFNCTNCTVSNNIASEAQFGSTNGNVANVNMTNVFVVDPWIALPNGYAPDSRHRIKTGSPSIGAGLNGVDCGAYGGLTPYVDSGIPAYPSISKIVSPQVGASTTPLTVTISSKSNN